MTSEEKTIRKLKKMADRAADDAKCESMANDYAHQFHVQLTRVLEQHFKDDDITGGQFCSIIMQTAIRFLDYSATQATVMALVNLGIEPDELRKGALEIGVKTGRMMHDAIKEGVEEGIKVKEEIKRRGD